SRCRGSTSRARGRPCCRGSPAPPHPIIRTFGCKNGKESVFPRGNQAYATRNVPLVERAHALRTHNSSPARPWANRDGSATWKESGPVFELDAESGQFANIKVVGVGG